MSFAVQAKVLGLSSLGCWATWFLLFPVAECQWERTSQRFHYVLINTLSQGKVFLPECYLWHFFPLRKYLIINSWKMWYFFSKCEIFKVIASVPHQSTSGFESHREFCVENMFPANTNFTSLNARKISIVAIFLMCCTVPRLSYMTGREKNTIFFFLVE